MSQQYSPPVHVVVMGVTATGKSAVARAVAAEMGLELIEGDDFHSLANVEKMAKGVPLGDEDRLPWLRLLAGMLAQRDSAGTSTILTCSALRRSYRDLLRGGAVCYFLHLYADFDVLSERMGMRRRHFMPTSLLRSQFDTLEPLGPDEAGAEVDVAAPLDEVVATAVRLLRSRHR